MSKSRAKGSEKDPARGDIWERFWFAPSTAEILILQRVGFAALATVFYASYSGDAPLWFAEDGRLATERLGRVVATSGTAHSATWHASPLYWVDSATGLRWYLAGGLATAAALAFGLCGRLGALIAWIVYLGLANRGWLVSGPGEIPLAIGMGALVIAGGMPRWPGSRGGARWTYGLATRLMQVHVAALLVAITAAIILDPELLGAAGVAGRLLAWVPAVGMLDLLLARRRTRPVLVLITWSLVAGGVTGDWLSAAAISVLLLSFLGAGFLGAGEASGADDSE